MGKIKIAKETAEQRHPKLVKAEAAAGKLTHWILCIYLLFLIIVWPFYFTHGYDLIGTDKSVFYRTVSIAAAWALTPLLAVRLFIHSYLFSQESVGRRRERRKAFLKGFSLTDWFALLYGAALVLSYLFSDYKESVLWGTPGWFLGLIPQLLFLALYFLYSRLWRRRIWMPGLIVPASAAVFALGYLNRFDVYPVPTLGNVTNFISTVGNINWYCGYLVTVLFGVVYLFWSGIFDKTWQKALLGAYVWVGFGTLVTQGSSSGILALLGVMTVLFCLSVPRGISLEEGHFQTAHRRSTAGRPAVCRGIRMKAFFETMLLLGAACIFTYVIRILFPNAINRTEITTELLTYSPVPFLMTAVALGMWLMIREGGKKGRYWKGFFRAAAWIVCGGIAVCVICFAALTAVNTWKPGSIGPLSDIGAFTFSPSWGSNRGATWTAGAMCFTEQSFWKKLIGVGPDGMSAFLYRDGSTALLSLVRERFGQLTLTNAHNEWLTVLVNTGILGLTGYAGMMVSAIVRFFKAASAIVWRNNEAGLRRGDKAAAPAGRTSVRKSGAAAEDKAARYRVIAGACGMSVLAYTVNNIVSFQQTFDTALVFLILGVGEACLRGEKEHES